MRRPPFASVWLFGFALLATSGVSAQDSTEARLREALRQTAEKLQTTEADLAQQQLATAAAERERDALKARPVSKVDAAQTVALQRKLASTDAELAQARSDQQKSQAEQQASAQIAQKKEAERAALAEQLAHLRARDQRCVANNEAFYGTADEILAMYRDPTFVNHVRNLHLWPLGFDRVKQENRMRALEDRFAEQHAQAQHCLTTDAAPASPTPSASPVAPAQAQSTTPPAKDVQ
jgi:chromosome segregation ATPase